MKKYILSILITGLSVLSLSAGKKYDKIDVHRRDKGKNGVAIVTLNNNYGLVDSLENEILAPIFNSISYLDDDLITVGKDDKYGLFNTSGIQVLPIEYEGIYFLKKGFYKVAKDRKIGVFSLKDQQITIPPIYDILSEKDYHITSEWFLNSDIYGPKRTERAKHQSSPEYNTVVGHINNEVSLLDLYTGKVIIPLGQYDLYPSDKYAYVVVVKGDQSGVVDYSNKQIVPLCDYDFDITEFGFITKDTHFGFGFLAFSGKELKPQYDEIIFFENGMARVREDNKYGVIDAQANEIIAPQYEELYVFDQYIHALTEKGQLIFDFMGRQIFPLLKYDNVEFFPKDEIAVVEKYGKYGMINTKGKELLPIKFNQVYYSSEYKIARIVLDRKVGIANKEGKIIVKPQYDGIKRFEDGVAEVGYYSADGNKIGLLDIEGNEILKPQFSSIFFRWNKKEWNFDNRYAVVYLDNKVGIVTRTGKVTVLPQYDEIIYQDRYNDEWEDVAITKMNKFYGLVNIKTGEVLFTPENQYIYTSGNGESILFVIRKDGKQAIIDNNGQTIIPFTSDLIQILDPDNKYFKKIVNGKVGLIDRKQNEVIPYMYDYMSVIKPGYLLVKENNLFGIVDVNNKVIIPLEYDAIQFCSPLQQLIGKKQGQIGFLFPQRKQFMPSEAAERYYKE